MMAHLLNGTSNGTHGARIAVVCRRESPDPGAAVHGTPLENRVWQQAQQQRVEHRLGALSAMNPNDVHHNKSLLTIASKHVKVAPHGHHAVLESLARRGARDSSRIELLPLLVRRREPKELIQVSCTVKHAHTRVNLKSHDDTILCRGPPLHHLPLDMYMFSSNPAVTHGARIGVMCRREAPDPGRYCMAPCSSTRCGNKRSSSAWSIA